MRWIFNGPELSGQELIDWLRSDKPRQGAEWSRSVHKQVGRADYSGSGSASFSWYGKGWFAEIKEDRSDRWANAYKPSKLLPGPMPYYV